MQKLKICIVDDNESVCHSLGILLNSIYQDEFEISTYSSPVLFLDEFAPDWKGCVIMDLFMPCWNGLDLMQELKQRGCMMYFIMMSGHGSTQVEAQSLAIGACAFVPKPFNVDKLITKINDVLRSALSTTKCNSGYKLSYS